jgi:hypothetical protein
MSCCNRVAHVYRKTEKMFGASGSRPETGRQRTSHHSTLTALLAATSGSRGIWRGRRGLRLTEHVNDRGTAVADVKPARAMS